MSIWSIIVFALLMLGALLALAAHLRAEPGPGNNDPGGSLTDLAADLNPAEHAIAQVFGFFGVSRAPLALALTVLLSTAAIAGGALDIIAMLHFGPAYPGWYPAVAGLTGLGIGMLCCRSLSS